MKKVSYRDYYLALRELQGKVDDRVSITDLGGSLDCPEINMGVNWASIGAVPADEAVAFAQVLTEAAKAAREFPYNGYQIEY